MIELKAEKVCPRCESQDRCAAIVMKDDSTVVKCVYFGQFKVLLKEAEEKINNDMYEMFKRCAHDGI